MLQGNTAKLFFLSLFGFLIRWCLFSGTVLGIYLFYKSDIYPLILSYANKTVMTLIAFAVMNLLRLIVMCLISAVKLGEQSAYYQLQYGNKKLFRLLFSYLSPKNSIPAFILYSKMWFYRLLWFLFFNIPAAISFYITFTLYQSGKLLRTSYLCLCIGTGLLLSVGLFFTLLSSVRYSKAPFYLITETRDRKNAIKESILATDGILKEKILFDSGFFGWILSCIFMIPAFYAVPYIKLSRTVFLTEKAINTRKEDINASDTVIKES